MALTEATIIDKIEILEDGQIQVRRSRRVFDGTELIAERYNRFVLEPGQDISTFPQRLRTICNAVWTPAVIAAYETAKAARR